MALRKSTATVFAAMTLIGGSALGLAGAASATTAPHHTPHHTAATGSAAQRRAAVRPALDCASGHVCGAAANGNSFDYYQCGVTYTLPNLVGYGPLVNNETGNVTAYFYDSNGNLLFSSAAGSPQTTVDWTPVQTATVC